MITLSGMTVKDESNPNGDIEIIFTGKRQGEKLFEELVIDSDLLETKHNSIMRADESYLDSELLDSYIEQLKDAVLDDNERAIKKVLSETVAGFDLNSWHINYRFHSSHEPGAWTSHMLFIFSSDKIFISIVIFLVISNF